MVYLMTSIKGPETNIENLETVASLRCHLFRSRFVVWDGTFYKMILQLYTYIMQMNTILFYFDTGL